VTTTVFRLIAPTSTSMARRTTVSLRDIVPPRDERTLEAVYLLRHQCQAARAMSLFLIDTHPTGPSLRLAFAYLLEGAVFGLEQNRFCDFAGQRYRGTKIYRTRVNSFHNPFRRIQSIRVRGSSAPLAKCLEGSRYAQRLDTFAAESVA
jgi:hypothetical protein